jgi:Family of unknown function (DUF6114)
MWLRDVMPRPVAAGLLTILGGFFVLVGGFLFALIGVVFAVFGIVSGIFLLGLLVGLLTIVMGLLMIALPSGHTLWGVVAISLAIVSIPVAFGGFIIGFLLTLIGGILSVMWKRRIDRIPTAEWRAVPPPSS